jgi:hypothetical protein
MREVASVGGGALDGAVTTPDRAVTTPDGAMTAPEGARKVEADPAMVLTFDTMTPVSGPYVGSANAVRRIPGGGLPWVLRSGTGSLSRDGHLLVGVRGLVLASRPSVPAALQGTNPFPAFRATVSCLSTDAAGQVTVTNVSTGDFAASPSGNWKIDARVSLPQPCIAPVVLVIGPSGVECWLAVTGG